MDGFDFLRNLFNFKFFDYLPLIATLLGGVLCSFLANSTRRTNNKFKNASVVKGKIIDIHSFGKSRYPLIKYAYNETTNTFKSSLGVTREKKGDEVRVEVASSGEARILSNANGQYEIVLAIGSFIFFLFFSVILYLKLV